MGPPTRCPKFWETLNPITPISPEPYKPYKPCKHYKPYKSRIPNPKPCKAYTLYTLNPKPQTLNPKPLQTGVGLSSPLVLAFAAVALATWVLPHPTHSTVNSYSPPKGIWGIWESYYSIPKASKPYSIYFRGP